MIIALRDKHVGKRCAIVGSSPTASLYNDEYDISIAVNGAAMLPHRFTYFMCGDHNSCLREWFTVNCSETRVIANLVATMDKILYPPKVFPLLNRQAIQFHNRQKLVHVPPPLKPHLTFSYMPYNEARLCRSNGYLMYKGTVSCCALQLAWMMGCTIIDLYGCSFTHDTGSYFYNSRHTGAVSKTQIATMQSTINRLRSEVEINVVGSSLLV